MNSQSFFARSIVVVVSALSLASSLQAIDIVHRKSTEKTVGGEITKNTRDSVTVMQQVGMKEETVPASDVSYIEWDAEPGPLKLARGSESTGTYDEAVKQYQEAVKAVSAAKDGLKADTQFGLARTTTKRAMRSGDDLAPAVALVKNFANSNRDNYRFFDAQLLLGDLGLATRDFSGAEIAYQSVAAAPWPDYQMAGKIGVARATLGRGDAAKAQTMFNEIAALPTKTPAEESRKLDAMLGQALCLQENKDFPASQKIIDQVIEAATPADSRVQAEAYLRQGDVLQAEGKNPKAAIIAYLHVDVIPEFATERDLHAEALYQLAKLWPAVGEAERGADASSRLKTQYPTSNWTKRLTGK